MRRPPVLLLLFFLTRGVLSEERFDPPLEGSYLGVRLEQSPHGFVVSDVVKGSAAERAGVRSGDLVVRLGDLGELAGLDVASFSRAVRDLEPGASVEVDLLRGDASRTIRITPDPLQMADVYALLEHLGNSRFLTSKPERRDLFARLRSELPGAVRSCRRASEVYEQLNRALGEIGLSHSSVIPPWTAKIFFESAQRALPTYHLGLILKRFGRRDSPAYFVHSIMAGSPASRAGLLIGDEVVAVNDRSVHVSARRTLAGFEAARGFYTIQVEPREAVDVVYRREEGGLTATVSLRADVPLSDLLSTIRSARLLETAVGPVGHIHLWSCLPARLPGELRKLLAGRLEPARALVVDLRGRGGQVPVLLKIEEILRRDRRPKALLVDSESRSAKEVLAFRMKGAPGLTLVGERTAGAVRLAIVRRLPSGALATLPGSPRGILRLTDGVDLEGRGVNPDHVVPFSIPYAAGGDAILERAVELMVEELMGSTRRVRSF